MTVLDTLNIINNTLRGLRRQYQDAERARANLDSVFASKIEDVKSINQEKREQINSFKDDVLKYYRIAKDNTSKDLVATGVSVQKPNIAKLNEMIERVSELNPNDPIAGKIVDLASRYISYLNREIKELDKAEQDQIRRILSQKDLEIGRVEAYKRQAIADCKTYLAGKDVQDLVSLFDQIEKAYGINSDYFSQWDKSKKKKRMMLIGFGEFPVDVPKALCSDMKAVLGKYFDESNKTVCYPCGFTTNSSESIYVEYTERNEEQARSGLQALVLNFIRYFKPSEFRISIFDQIYQNADLLGDLSMLSGTKNNLIDEVPIDDKTMKQSMKRLCDYYRKVESKIGVGSIYAYNANVEPSLRIPLRMIILNGQQETYGKNEVPGLSYVINNAAKFGITVFRLIKSKDGGSKGTERERSFFAHAKDYIRLISDDCGGFYIEDSIGWAPFHWIEAPSSIPPDFLSRVARATKPFFLGAKYFDRYKPAAPKRTRSGKRKLIELPFAIDDDDKPIICSFENETFAAYVMGAAGSGKSTLLHTLICGILMNYHPDEVELWLMDFKMLEFKRYVDNRPPHIRYLLLEKSEDLVFDMLDRLTEELERREYVFAQNGWQKLSDVPAEEYMPAVFIVIDEFAQMSQILKETKGSGCGSDYTIKLENLLARGRALGFKFIFASQTYTTGITGLTETACKQIQLRFALKNTPDEIKQTLTLTSDQMTSEVNRDISSLPAYETLFKWRDDNGEVRVGRFKNMYAESAEIDALVSLVRNKLKPTSRVCSANEWSYVEKSPVMVDGRQPKTLQSQIPVYREYERTLDDDYLDEGDILIYPGVPCSFNLARPFTLLQGTGENILIAGGDRDNSANVAQSIISCFIRTKNPVEIWGHARSPILKKYRNSVFSKREQHSALADICARIRKLRTSVMRRETNDCLIVCFGLESIFNDLEIMGDDIPSPIQSSEFRQESNIPDMSEVLGRVKTCSDSEEKKRIIAEYNALRDATEREQGVSESEQSFEGSVYDARDDLKWLLKHGSNFGIHFLLCFPRAQDFIDLKLDGHAFRHKLLFPVSRDESLAIISSRKANEIDGGTFVYSDSRSFYTMRPHIYKGIPCNGWSINEKGQIVQRGGVV